MSAPHNVVAQIAGYRRASRSLLVLDVDPARAALIAGFELRTGLDIKAVLLDVLDDIIFDTGRQSSGADDHRPAERAEVSHAR